MNEEDKQTIEAANAFYAKGNRWETPSDIAKDVAIACLHIRDLLKLVERQQAVIEAANAEVARLKRIVDSAENVLGPLGDGLPF